MKLTIKPEHIDDTITSPFNNTVYHMRFVPEELYIHFYNRGLQYLFEEDKPIQPIKKAIVKDNIDEIKDK